MTILKTTTPHLNTEPGPQSSGGDPTDLATRISRRSALIGAGAATVVAALPSSRVEATEPLAALEANLKQLRAVEDIENENWRIWEDKDENRLFISHGSKPSAEVRAALKRHGFRWNRTATAWSRMLNESAWANAKYLAENGLLD